MGALHGALCREVSAPEGFSVQEMENKDYCLITLRLRSARQLSLEQFEHQTAESYRIIQHELEAVASYPVRIWNHLPDIHASGGSVTDRYMAFNAGRFQAFSQWLGGAGTFDQTVPTASAVGHNGNDLVIHALGFSAPGLRLPTPGKLPHIGIPNDLGPFRPVLPARRCCR